MRSRESGRGGIALLAAGLCVLAVVVGASGALSPKSVSLTFVKGYLGGDPAACDVATPRLRAVLAKLGEVKTCRAAFMNRAGASAATDDKEARRALTAATEAAQFVIVDRLAARRAARYWTSARYTQLALVRDLEDYGVPVQRGAGPAAARGLGDDVVVLDTRRSSRTRLVLYTESRSGTIWRLTPTTTRTGTPTRSTTRGTPGTPIVATAVGFPSTAEEPARVVVSAPVADRQVDFLVVTTSTPAVDALLLGTVLVPLRRGTGGGDTGPIADQLVDALTRKDAAALCALYDPSLVARAAELFGSGCGIVRDATSVKRVALPEHEGWSADGTAIVALEVTADGTTLRLHHVVTPGPNGYRVTGLLFDLDEIVALALRPI